MFKPYSHDQVLLILQGRLADLSLEVFSAETKVIEFMARKAIIVAGDLRVAMKVEGDHDCSSCVYTDV